MQSEIYNSLLFSDVVLNLCNLLASFLIPSCPSLSLPFLVFQMFTYFSAYWKSKSQRVKEKGRRKKKGRFPTCLFTSQMPRTANQGLAGGRHPECPWSPTPGPRTGLSCVDSQDTQQGDGVEGGAAGTRSQALQCWLWESSTTPVLNCLESLTFQVAPLLQGASKITTDTSKVY